ncbi:MAG: DUF2071 domain-containing protein [Gemmataceae bacterium]|nr:DUF2071 domain-containing protein [Gemmataceae bacterium]
MTTPTKRFLTAGWHHLVMLNYEVDPDLVARFVPAGTEIDFFCGKTYLSVVGFRFLNTRLLGVPVPCHRDFDEVNLRCYVKRTAHGETRRGVTFIRELVPKRMVALVANRVYNENYIHLPMRSRIDLPHNGSIGRAAYEWRDGGRWDRLSADFAGVPLQPAPGSEPEFITEHYWGYTRQRDGGTLEYQVEHPPWRVWTAVRAHFECDVAALYGPEFAPYLLKPPTSAFVADGSEVVVRRGVRLGC